MKRILVVLVTLAMLATTCFTVAFADDYDMYLYGYNRTGVCICTQCTLRATPSTNGTSVGRLRNGETCYIVGQYGNDWFMVGLGDGSYGFVKAGLVKADPMWIVLTKYTYLYATPWDTGDFGGLRNGEQSGRAMLVLGQRGSYYAVQCREGTAGTSFVHTWDVGSYSNGANLYVCAEQVDLLDSPSGTKVTTADRFTIVTVDSMSGDYYHVVVNAGTAEETSGWVLSRFIHPVIN